MRPPIMANGNKVDGALKFAPGDSLTKSEALLELGTQSITATGTVTLVRGKAGSGETRIKSNIILFDCDGSDRIVKVPPVADWYGELTIRNISSAADTLSVQDSAGSAVAEILSGESSKVYGSTSKVYADTPAGAGVKAGATVSVQEFGDGVWHKTVLTCVATPITIADEAGQGQYGGVKVYDFPEGMLATLGAVIDGSVIGGVTGTIIATWDGDIGLGVEVVSDHQDATGKIGVVLQSTATSQAIAKVANVDAVTIATKLTESGARWLDGTGTAKDLYLNLLVDDSASHTAGTATFTGTISFMWAILGDK